MCEHDSHETSEEVQDVQSTLPDAHFCCHLPSSLQMALICTSIFMALLLYFLPKVQKLDWQIRKHVIITGGSSGIGFSLAATILKKYGSNVVITLVARNKVRLERAKQGLIDSTSCEESQIQVFSSDVTDSESLSRTVSDACEQCEIPVSVLVCSAGVTAPKLIQDTDSDTFKQIMDINVLGSFNAVKAALPFMTGIANNDVMEDSSGDRRAEHQRVSELAVRLRSRERFGSLHNNPICSICFVSSQAGCIGLVGYSAYSSSKFALRGLAEAVQMELRPYNVNVTLTHPPDTETPSLEKENQERSPLLRQISETSAAWSSQKVADKILNDITNALFLSHFGPIGWLLSISTASCAPVHAVSHFVIEILLAGIVRFVSLFFQWDFNSKIQHALANEMKERQKAAKDD